MTPAELKALDAAATKGPWKRMVGVFQKHIEKTVTLMETVDPDPWLPPLASDGVNAVAMSVMSLTPPSDSKQVADHDLMCAVRNALPALIRLWEAAEKCGAEAPGRRITESEFYVCEALRELRETKL